MALETGTYISDLVSTNPTASDAKSQGDDHLRLLKSTIKATFPNVSNAVTPTHTELNYVDGVTSAIQTQIDTKGAIAGQTWTGNHDFPTQTQANNSTKAATTAYVDTLGATKVSKSGDTYTGTHDLSGATSVLVPAATVGGQAINLTQLTATAFSSALPSQTGNAGKFVTTNGTSASWELPIADQSGNSGKFLTTNGTTTSWGTVDTPGLVFISTASASASATIDITGLSSTYSEYLLVCTAVVPATTASTFRLRTSTNGGSSYDAGASDYKYAGGGFQDDATSLTSVSAGTTQILLGNMQIGSTHGGGNWQIRLHKPSAASKFQVSWLGSGENNGGIMQSVFGSGIRDTAADVDAIRLLFSAGNITSGEFKLYGLRAS